MIPPNIEMACHNAIQAMRRETARAQSAGREPDLRVQLADAIVDLLDTDDLSIIDLSVCVRCLRGEA